MNTRLPSIPEDVLMQFVTIVALAAVTVAFVAYVGTWFAGWRQQRKAAAEAELLPPTPVLGEPAGNGARNGARERLDALRD